MLNISEMATDTAIITMEGEQETVPKLSNGTISVTTLIDLWPVSVLQGYDNIQRQITRLGLTSGVWSI